MKADLSMPQLISTITLRVRFARLAGVRLWLAARIMTIAALVAGCGIEIATADDPVDRPGAV